jgi:adenylate kinase family enzyme
MAAHGTDAMPRIHVFGASGSGSTTLGEALAQRLCLPHADADHFFWLPTDPPFTMRRPRSERLAMLTQALPADGHWVFSGSAISWATALEPAYDLIVFLHLDPTVRMQRLYRRETARYGARIEPGGDMAMASATFFQWAAAYDTAGLAQRSLAAHEAWLGWQTAQVLRLDAAMSVDALVGAVEALQGRSPGASSIHTTGPQRPGGVIARPWTASPQSPAPQRKPTSR